MLFEMIDGRRPFEGEAKELIAHKVATPAPALQGPSGFVNLVGAMLERDCRLRPSARAVHQHLTQESIFETDTSSLSDTLYPVPTPQGKRRIGVFWGIMVAFAIVVLGLLNSTRKEEKTVSAPPEAPTTLLSTHKTSAPVRFVILHDCTKDEKDCPPEFEALQAYEMVEVAYEVFREGGLEPYVASLEYHFSPLLQDPDRVLTWSKAQLEIAPLLPDVDQWAAPQEHTVLNWLKAAADCAGTPSDIVVWVWRGPSIASTPQNGRHIFINFKDAQKNIGLFAQLLAQYVGLDPSARRYLKLTRFEDAWANPDSSLGLGESEVAQVRRWVDGQIATTFRETLPCSGLHRNFSKEIVDDFIWWSNGDLSFARQKLPVRFPWYRPIAGDFDGDGVDDVFWHSPGPRWDIIEYFSNDRSSSRSHLKVNGDYHPIAGDFDNDGQDDIMWLKAGQKVVPIWWMRAERGHYELGQITSPLGKGAQTGDFDGDGRSDVLWFQDGERPKISWSELHRTFSTTMVPRISRGAPYVADFDGDGRSDIFWFRPGAANRDEVWFGRDSRTFLVDAQHVQVSGNYKVAVGDFDGDGDDDILWNGKSRQADVWRALGDGRFDPIRAIVLPMFFSPVVGDFDGDGDDDIFWYDAKETSPEGGRRSIPLPKPKP